MDTAEHHEFDLTREVGRGEKGGHAWASFQAAGGAKLVFWGSVPPKGELGTFVVLEGRLKQSSDCTFVFSKGVVRQEVKAKRREQAGSSLIAVAAAQRALRLAHEALAHRGQFGVEEALTYTSHALESLGSYAREWDLHGEGVDPSDEEAGETLH